jgi:hypothetical protein
MYHSEKNPLKAVRRDSDPVFIPKGIKARRLHKAFLRYHDPENWELLREALKRMGRSDLIGNGKRHLIPTWQPAGTGSLAEGARRPLNSSAKPVVKTGANSAAKTNAVSTNSAAKPAAKTQTFRTKHTGLPTVSKTGKQLGIFAKKPKGKN